MPYTIRNHHRFHIARTSEWYRVSDARLLTRALRRVDYSVVASRREGHTAILDFLDTGRVGQEFFSRTVRFPHENADIYITEFDSLTANTLTALTAVLSWRSTTVAKDSSVSVARSNSNQPPPDPTGPEQGVQDNTKRFEELTKSLSALTRMADTDRKSVV